MRGETRRLVLETLAAIAGIALTIALGLWQLARAHEKRDLEARFAAHAHEPAISVPQSEIAARDIELRRVEARGVFDPRYGVFIDNRIHRGVPGYYVVMPLRVAGGDVYVLVNRGWIAAGAERTQLPEIRTPRDAVTVSGIAIVPGRRIFELSKNVVEGAIWQNLTIARYRGRVPIHIQPFVIQQDSALDDGLVREWDPPDFGIEKHYGYAFQWFALSATIVVIYAIVQVRRRKAAAAP